MTFFLGGGPRVRKLGAAAATLTAALVLAVPSGATTKATHKDWPPINGALILNDGFSSRPIDMRAGKDPFQGTDPEYRCAQRKKNQLCFAKIGACVLRNSNFCAAPPVIPEGLKLHNELLGHHGNDTIYAGAAGDVIWGDYDYPANPTTQRDKLYGGPGRDLIYASHGTNEIHTGGGRDIVFARVGRGKIFCDSPSTLVYLSKRTKRVYTLSGCKRITLKAIGTEKA